MGASYAGPGRGGDGPGPPGSPPGGPRAQPRLFHSLCTLLAEVVDDLGHTEDGLQALVEAHTLVEQHEERVWEAEVYRLGASCPAAGDAAGGGGNLAAAALAARRQEAKSLELRAAMSLSRLWQQQGKQVEARELLAPVYGWFTEGFDTADLQEAKALLEGLT